ncbi:hypothetical protein [Aureimonas fodinaquatilis]|nr:hypothetical protein [Aureimonas fodinaquatilis]
MNTTSSNPRRKFGQKIWDAVVRARTREAKRMLDQLGMPRDGQ